MNRVLLFACVSAAVCLQSPTAIAVTNVFTQLQPAAGNCQAALARYDASLRKRPGGILNIGTAPVYITCGMPSDSQSDVTRVWVTFTSYTTLAQTVKCTLVTGKPYWNASSFSAERGIVQGPGVVGEGIDFQAGYFNNGVPFASPQALSCILPPNVEMNTNAVEGTKQIN